MGRALEVDVRSRAWPTPSAAARCTGAAGRRDCSREVTTWPANTVADLKTRYFGESSRQIGVDDTNDFIFGELHNACAGGCSTSWAPFSRDSAGQLPPSPLLKGGEQLADLLRMLGLDSAGALSTTTCATCSSSRRRLPCRRGHRTRAFSR